MRSRKTARFVGHRSTIDSIHVPVRAVVRVVFAVVGLVVVSGCASVSSYIVPDGSRGDPGRVDAKISVANAVMGPGERGRIELSRVTKTVYEAFRQHGGFREVVVGSSPSDYEFVPSVIKLTDLFDNVVHLRLQGRNRASNNVVFDSKFVGSNLTQGSSLRNIASALANQMPTIRAAIQSDLPSPHQHTTHSPPRPRPAVVALRPPVSTAGETPQVSPPAQSIKTVGARWALVIGISAYQDSRIPSLRYAASDAQAFYSWLVSPEGGKHAPSRVKLLVDKDATGKGLKDALFGWLKQALEEDVVTIYFAGHGSPESPDSPDNLFLLPCDTQYDSIHSTGFPMWDLETALKRFIKAKKVVVLADACHSGGVGQSFDIARRSNRGLKVNPIGTGIHGLSRVGDGVCVISASDERQYSQESSSWGGGHSVFTFFLLKGLRGDADFNSDASVTLGELTSYLSQEVRRATKNAQSPTVAGRYDPALTIGK